MGPAPGVAPQTPGNPQIHLVNFHHRHHHDHVSPSNLALVKRSTYVRTLFWEFGYIWYLIHGFSHNWPRSVVSPWRNPWRKRAIFCTCYYWIWVSVSLWSLWLKYISVNKAGIIGIRVCIGQSLTMHIVPPHVEEVVIATRTASALAFPVPTVLR